MSSRLPSTITLKTTRGDRQVPVVELGATDVPDHDGGSYASELTRESGWDGHHRDRVKPFLTGWSFPDKVQEIRDRVESALEEGIPDQKRTMLRNQEFGQLDERWITDIAIGEEVERPWTRWSKAKRGEVRVAICLDTTVACFQNKELMEARMCVAAGLASALEMLDYEVSIVGASVQYVGTCGGKARTKPQNAQVFVTIAKDEAEPFVDSGFAHFADTGLRRLMCCWVMRENGYVTQLTDSEWRELTEADLLVYVGPVQKPGGGSQGRWGRRGGQHVINTEGLPSDEGIGPQGDDVLHLHVDGHADVDSAVGQLETFFNDMLGD